MKKILILFIFFILKGNLFSQDDPNNYTAPEFTGGDKAMMDFVKLNCKYPLNTLQQNINKENIVRFLVKKDGSIDSIQIFNSDSSSLDNEIVRLISIMPLWKPGYNKTEPIDTWFAVPVAFFVDVEVKTYIIPEKAIASLYKSYSNALNYPNYVKELYIGSGSVKEVPNNIDTFPNLELLDYSGSQIDKLPESFKNLDKLKTLDLSNCSFTEFPNEICDLESLEELDFGINKITKIPIEILNCKNLKTINLEYTSIPKEEQKALKKQLKGIKLKF
jgi:hypothetical protein